VEVLNIGSGGGTKTSENQPSGSMRTYVPVTEFRFTVFEHDPNRPWLVLGPTKHLTVELERAGDFPAWASEHWPGDRYTAELDPGQEEQRLRPST
jgi:hypothetical protein